MKKITKLRRKRNRALWLWAGFTVVFIALLPVTNGITLFPIFMSLFYPGMYISDIERNIIYEKDLKSGAIKKITHAEYNRAFGIATKFKLVNKED